MICNMDCFNCIYPDCINNGRETKSERTMKKVDKEKKKDSYYQRNREKCLAKVKEYRSKHSEWVKEYQKEYYRRNAEEKKEYRKRRYRELSKNPEYLENHRKRCENYRRKKRLEKEMLAYDVLKNATANMRTAAGSLEDADVLAHCLTITIDRWCADRGKDTAESIRIAREVMDNLVEQREANKQRKEVI